MILQMGKEELLKLEALSCTQRLGSTQLPAGRKLAMRMVAEKTSQIVDSGICSCDRSQCC